MKKFGATGDGKTHDTAAINKAIDAAHAAGGGTVLIPAGSYLCYSIHLQSNVAILLDSGATIVAAETSESGGYDAPEPKWKEFADFKDHIHPRQPTFKGSA